VPDERDGLRLGVQDGEDVGEQDFGCRGQLVLGEARRLPVTEKVGGEDLPVVTQVPDQLRPGRARLGQPVYEHHRVTPHQVGDEDWTTRPRDFYADPRSLGGVLVTAWRH
jgi:hypothetical protein